MTTTTTKRHPIRGFFYGIFFGLGLALVGIGQKWVALGTWPPFILLIVGIIVGTIWSTYGPAKAPKGPAPSSAEPEPMPEPSDPGDAVDASDEASTEAAPLDDAAVDTEA